ncbi:DNA polymerase III subunit beta [Oceanotoga sp. DSM 15011]|uniref:DNA polymerase III subunit beta n=1 Tax=Oceanotoga sp. DSM 15011 TaxID=2984951 RepID=UPI0021F3CEE7|nr:DNA polymerase III subunit beta [Oceanotoga sp. DSM 15011]UYP01120.1 DNA polymerase III subunit beta [Oceanotoga sp. DSM 15011]
MTFEIEKKGLNNALEMASNAVARKTTNPVLAGIKMHATKDKLHIYATDLQTGFHISLDSKNNDEEFSCVVDQKVFSEIVKTLPDGLIKITYNEILEVESGNSSFKIPTMGAEEFPKVIPDVMGSTLELEKDSILKMIEKVIFCALKDSDPLSKNLNGVYWDFREGGYLTLVASDSYRLALSENKIQEDTIPSSFLLSLKSMEELKIVLSNSKTEKIKLNFDGSRALFHFDDENIELVLNVVDAKYPNYTDIIPQAFKTKMTISNSQFMSSLKRVSIAAGKTEQIKMQIEEDSITFTANSPDVGEATETLPIEKDGEDMLIAYSPRFLREAIEKIETTEIEFNISGDINPTILKPIQDNSYMYIVMPTRWA